MKQLSLLDLVDAVIAGVREREERAILTPVSRASDPATSHEAATAIEPTRGTKKANVLHELLLHRGLWVPGHVFTRPEVGGSEGLRRLRELAADGWPIQKKLAAKGRTTWLYRLP